MSPQSQPKEYPEPPAHIARYHAAMGRETTIRFLLTFGGAELYIPKSPRASSRLVCTIGMDAARKLAGIRDQLPYRVPLAKDIAANFPPERRWGRSALHAWWQRNLADQKRPKA